MTSRDLEHAGPKDSDTGPELLARAAAHGDRPALVVAGRTWTYRELLVAAAAVAARLGEDARGEPVAILMPPGAEHVAAQWGAWMAGGIAMPLGLHAPAPELRVLLEVSGARLGVAMGEFGERLREAGLAVVHEVAFDSAVSASPDVSAAGVAPAARAVSASLPSDPAAPAYLLFTSGTTGRPKGVPLTHANLAAQVRSLVAAWAWSADDRILGVLPLHHVHGLVNVLACALWCGATCELHPRFDALATWERLASGDLTLFMAVPTIYQRLLETWRDADAATRERWSRGASGLRLMVSGSAALPATLLEAWREVSGQVLLERYGMTEIGMALSNPLHGPRVPGHVGAPLPGVDVRLVDESGAAVRDGEAGEIEVRGPSVFSGYWRDPAATAAAFRDGWFRTGDLAVREPAGYRILGRASQDILKSGGEKLSALEIENALLDHPAVRECAVVGLPDARWGDLVAAAVVAEAGRALDPETLRAWLADRVAPAKVPKRWLVVEGLPRNALGKVIKPAVREMFGREP